MTTVSTVKYRETRIELHSGIGWYNWYRITSMEIHAYIYSIHENTKRNIGKCYNIVPKYIREYKIEFTKYGYIADITSI